MTGWGKGRGFLRWRRARCGSEGDGQPAICAPLGGARLPGQTDFRSAPARLPDHSGMDSRSAAPSGMTNAQGVHHDHEPSKLPKTSPRFRHSSGQAQPPTLRRAPAPRAHRAERQEQDGCGRAEAAAGTVRAKFYHDHRGQAALLAKEAWQGGSGLIGALSPMWL